MCDVNHSVKTMSSSDQKGSARRPTQADVARLAGVSTATVSHVLSGRADRKGAGNAQTRARVERAMKQLDYRPNWAGRALRRQRTGLVGALVSAGGNPWRDSLITVAKRELAKRSLDLVVFPDVGEDEATDRLAELLDRGAVDACFTVHLEEAGEVAERLERCPIPSVAFAEGDAAGLPTVRHGYAEAAAEAAVRLRDRGVRRFMIATEAMGPGHSLWRDVVDPIRTALAGGDADELRAEHLEIDYRISADLGPLDWASLEAAGPEDPIVLMCSSDRLAIQIAAECERRSIDIGRAVGVVGRGDIAEAAERRIPLSTLGTSETRYEDVFAALAASAESGEKLESGWEFPWHVIERASTAGIGRQA
ncbi:hypothetical protein CFK39_11080 [Brachybacterium avium]|uniref:HTH lacI-type domain-containing protein n=2 Tax=Brachybacterium avium TaxID=2017485 RepID=A0A220UE95_9MICO|nr:hypothetical protein CFK39_11080 [Brachybacterium avium]